MADTARHMTNQQRDWIAIIGVALALVIQAGGLIWWGSKITAVQADHEKRLAGVEERERSESLRNAKRDADIAVIAVQVTDIKAAVGRVETKLENRR